MAKRFFKVICYGIVPPNGIQYGLNSVLTENELPGELGDQYVKSEHVAEIDATEAKELGYTGEIEAEYFKHIVTKDDVANNPGGELVEGEKIGVPLTHEADKKLEADLNKEAEVKKLTETQKPPKNTTKK